MADIIETKVLIITTSGFDQAGLQMALQELRKHSATVTVVGPDRAPIRGWAERRWGRSITPDKCFGEVDANEHHAVVLPGVMNPDSLRRNRQALHLIMHFIERGRVIAAAGHAPWLLAEVDALRSHAVVFERGVIICRSPADLPALIATLIAMLHEELRAVSAPPLPAPTAAPPAKWSRYAALLSRSLPRPIEDHPAAIQTELLSP